MENARFPEVIDLITGNFPRHSLEFHQWRAEETKKQLKLNPKAMSLYDDLAVSQHKLGDHAAACETMKLKESIEAGIYETYSNMGTFLIYSGDLPRSLEFINKALSINPQAHFGREKYQKWLVEWLIAKKPNISDRYLEAPAIGFAAFVISKQPPASPGAMTEELRQEAVRGVLGMMRFADFDNPILQEALGDLLCAGKSDANAPQLACIAYLQALKKSSEPEDKNRLTLKIEATRAGLVDEAQKQIVVNLEKELIKGATLASDIRVQEMKWIKEDKDASVEFTKKYLKK